MPRSRFGRGRSSKVWGPRGDKKACRNTHQSISKLVTYRALSMGPNPPLDAHAWWYGFQWRFCEDRWQAVLGKVHKGPLPHVKD